MLTVQLNEFVNFVFPLNNFNWLLNKNIMNIPIKIIEYCTNSKVLDLNKSSHQYSYE